MTVFLSFKDDRLRNATLADTSRERWMEFAGVVNSVPLIYGDCKHADFWLFPYFIDVGVKWLVRTILNRPSVISLHVIYSSDDWFASRCRFRLRLIGLLSCLLITSCSINHGGSSCLGWGTFGTLFSFCFFLRFSLCFSCCCSCSLRSRHWSQICILVAYVKNIAILKFEGLNCSRVTFINRLTHCFIFKKFQLVGSDLESLTQFRFQIVQCLAKIDLDSGASCFREHPKDNTITHLCCFNLLFYKINQESKFSNLK